MTLERREAALRLRLRDLVRSGGEIEDDVKDIKGKQRVDVDLRGETRRRTRRNENTCLAKGFTYSTVRWFA